MKWKYWHYVAGIVLLVLGGILCFERMQPEPEEGSASSNDHHQQNGPHLDEMGNAGKRYDRLRNDGTHTYGYEATPIQVPPEMPNPEEIPRYQAGGSGTQGAIRDKEGNLIWRATKETPVYSISISPNEEMMVVGAGDGKAYIITSKGEKICDMPQFPKSRNMLGLGNWVWIGNDRLLGESGVQNYDGNGNPVGCCQDHNMSESRYYVYDLGSNTMEEMQLPVHLRGKVVKIGKVMKTGEFQMGHDTRSFEWHQLSEHTRKR